MDSQPSYDLSVLLLYRDDEDVIVRAVGALAEAFAATSVRLEIMPVDLGSGDNTRAIMNIMPVTCAVHQPAATSPRSLLGPALDGANGQVLCIVDPNAALAVASQLAQAYDHVAARGSDAVQVSNHCIMLRRDRNERALRGLVGLTFNVHARLTSAIKRSGRSVAPHASASPTTPNVPYTTHATQWAAKLLGRAGAPSKPLHK